MDIAEWIARYERAWSSNDPDDIRGLFTADAEYRSAPYRPPAAGHEAIVDFWLSHRDDGEWRFRWRLLGRDGATYFVEGETEYAGGPANSNLWVIRIEGERAASFTEWWMELPADG